jgi:hypothetical protein
LDHLHHFVTCDVTMEMEYIFYDESNSVAKNAEANACKTRGYLPHYALRLSLSLFLLSIDEYAAPPWCIPASS